jgi:hypothetical protein
MAILGGRASRLTRTSIVPGKPRLGQGKAEATIVPVAHQHGFQPHSM